MPVRKDIPTGTVITDNTSESSSSLEPMDTGLKKSVTWADIVRKNNDN